jgi:DNA-directed RNA polymerase sigma subunit (sigma70/sigma32)
MARKSKIYSVDFNSLERRAGGYKSLNAFEKELVDKMCSLSNSSESNLSPYQLDALDSVYEAIEKLTPRQQQVLSMTFGLGDDEPSTELQIAEKFSITQQGVHDLKTRAIKAIQKQLFSAKKTPKP